MAELAKQKLNCINYNGVLICTATSRSLNFCIRSRNNHLETVERYKISLNAFDNKGFIHNDEVKMTAFGQTFLRGYMFFRELGSIFEK